MRKSIKLTSRILRRMIQEEKFRVSETLEQGKEDSEKVDAEEVDADSYAGALEKDLDHLKALKISESRIRKTLVKIMGKKKFLLKNNVCFLSNRFCQNHIFCESQIDLVRFLIDLGSIWHQTTQNNRV